MHLLFFNSAFPQPSQTFVLDQVRHAVGLGLDVTVFAKRYSPVLAREHAADLEALVIHDRPRNAAMLAGIARGAARHPRHIGVFADRRAALALHASDLVCALQTKGVPDAIIANFGQNGIAAARIKQAFFPGARLAVIFHGWDLSGYVAANGWEDYRRAAPAIDVAIAVNRPWAERLRANTPIRNVAVHHLGVDPARIAVRPIVPRGDRPFAVLFVGRMVEKKGLDVLIAAAAQLTARGHALTIDVVGDGPEDVRFRAAAAESGLAEVIRFHGGQPHPAVLAMMQESDCLVLPSVTAANGDQEGIPVTLMEAMAAGLPAVSTFHSGIPELIADGESGLLVPERDSAALAAALERLIREDSLGRRLAAAGRATIERDFNANTQNRVLFELILGARLSAP
ncbi:MAG: glycosyltransferase [Bauldia sp.]|nr:glycosyltransferase [Bauldia sp.]